MKTQYSTEKMVAELITTMLGSNTSPRESYLLREALHGLVRLAKSEQILEMKSNVRKLTGHPFENAARSRSRGQTINRHSAVANQQQFEFMKCNQ